MKYKIEKINKSTGERQETGLTYELKRDPTTGELSETGDAAVEFAKTLEDLFNDGHRYEVHLV